MSSPAQQWRKYAAEFVCTALFVFLSTGAIVQMTILDRAAGMPFSADRITVIALAFGMSLTALIYAAGPVSGGHINPAVTFAFMVTKLIHPVVGCLYIVAQCLGGIVGALLVAAAFPKGARDQVEGGATFPTDLLDYSVGQAFVLELVMTFALVFTVFATVKISKDKHTAGSLAPLAIGFIVLACHLTGATTTGCGINPARSLGPAVVNNKWTDFWIYIVAPMLAGAIGGPLWVSVFAQEGPSADEKNEDEGL